MTLKEAVESGKPFRHKNQAHAGKYYTKGEFNFEWVTLDELISDDWEIQQKETFTREDVERAINFLGREYSLNRSNTWFLVFDKAMKAAEEIH